MSLCPNTTELNQWLSDRLPARDQEQIGSHVDDCPACQGVLDELTAPFLGTFSRNWRGGGATAILVAGLEEIADISSLTPLLSDRDPGEGRRSLPHFWCGWRIHKELGQGGMSVVYLAEQPPLKRLVALKVLKTGIHANEQERARFRAEAEALAHLQHPNIVQIFEVGTESGQDYLILEYVPGGSLRQRLAGTPQDPRGAARLIQTLAEAIHYAHQHGIIHRDLKPANVLLSVLDGPLSVVQEDKAASPQITDHGSRTIPKIADFGLARTVADPSGPTRTGEVLGTPSYMAPEQAQGQGRLLGPATDVYALGAILYEMLTGRPPFRGATSLSTLEQVVNQDPVPPSKFQRYIPCDLETICLKCLDKDPRKRYASAADLADDLQRCLDGKPIVARRTALWERVWKWARRRPGIAGLSAAVVLISVLGLGLVAEEWLRANRGWQQAEDKHRETLETQAHLAFDKGLTLCEQGDINHGLLWFVRSLELAERAGVATLERPIRANLAAWSHELSASRLHLKHGHSLHALAFSPDDRVLASAGYDGNVRFWDLTSGIEIGPPLEHTATTFTSRRVFTVQFSPDGKWVASGTTDGRARLWDAHTHQLVGQPLVHPALDIWCVAFSPDGRLLATACSDGAARLWETATGRLAGGPMRHGTPAARNADIQTLAFRPDGKALLTGGRDGMVRIWDVATGKLLCTPLRHSSWVVGAAFSPREDLFVSASIDGTVRMVHQGGERPRDLPPQGASVHGLAFRPDGRTLVTGNDKGLVRLWDVATGRPVGQFFRQEGAVKGLAFSHDGKLLAIGAENGGIRLCQAPRPRTLGAPLAHDGAVFAVAFGEGNTLLTAGPDVYRWNEAKGLALGTSRQSNAAIKSATIAEDGRRIAAGGVDGRAWVRDVATGKILFTTPPHPGEVRQVGFSPDGSQLCTYGPGPPRERLTDRFLGELGNLVYQRMELRASACWLWDAGTGKRLRPLLQKLNEPVNCLTFGRDGRTLLLGCRDGTLRFWDVTTDQEAGSPLRHSSGITAAVCSADGARILTGCRDGTVRLWSATGHKSLLEPLRQQQEVMAVAFSSDGSLLLTGGLDGGARFWDAATGKQIGPTLWHADHVLSVAFHPSGTKAATGSRDRTIQCWRVPAEPLAGDVDNVRLWLQVLTGLELDDRGGVHPVAAEMLAERRRHLDERGGVSIPIRSKNGPL